jgi:hypothetical protein
MQVELSEVERQELVQLVKTAYSEINPEIHHTMDRNYRERLHERRSLLEVLLKRLGGNVQSSQ